MSGQEHIKVVTKDHHGNARLKFQSSKKRKRHLTADIYRSSSSQKKLRGGTTASIATREHRVHHPQRSTAPTSLDFDDVTTTFATELDVAMDRNATELFKRFYYEVWPLVRSLPEIIHHRSKIIDLLLQYMLSPIDQPNEKSTLIHGTDASSPTNERRAVFRPNLVTVDLLHLLAVLARDVRHELHDHMHAQILPRLYFDLLSPPSDHRAPYLLDVSLIELVFRTISYLFKYDMEALIHDASSEKDSATKTPRGLESLRRYYGVTLGHPNDTIRRLAAESFAPVIRQASSQRRHLRRVLRALSSVSGNDKMLSPALAFAVDGIAHLLFEVGRGAAGRLHSKCGPMVVSIVIDVIIEMNDALVIQKVVSAYFHLLCSHLPPQQCLPVLETVIQAILHKCDNDSAKIQLLHILKSLLLHRNGVLLRDETANVLPPLEQLFSTQLHIKAFQGFNPICRDAVLNVLFTTLQFVPEGSGAFAQRMTDLLRLILALPVGAAEADLVASRVIENYIPHVPAGRSLPTLGTGILRTAISLLMEQPNVAMTLIHGLAAVPIHSGRAANEQGDIFFLDRARFCSLSNAEIEAVVKTCCQGDVLLATEDDLVAVMTAGIVAAFAVAVGYGSDGVAAKEFQHNFQTVSDWHLHLLQRLADDNHQCSEQSSGMCRSMLIESLSSLSNLACRGGDSPSIVQSVLTVARPMVVRHLLANPLHLWTLKSAASFVIALQCVNMQFVDDMPDDVFDALIPCLRSRNHFHHLYALQILVTFPKRPYVVDHADLDFTDDLDEEQDVVPTNETSGLHSNIGLSGPCHLMDMLLSIESTPVDMNSERSILSNISRIGVLGRTGKLPVVYAEAAVSHLLGLFYTKYAPIWPVAVKALVDLTHGHEDCVWPALHSQIAASVNNYDVDREESIQTSEIRAQIVPATFYSLCSAWETSNGENASLFAYDIKNSQDQGLVSRHHSTDESSVFASLWNVVQGAPKLMLAHSRTIVPIFLNFMHYQYYEVHTNDPDSRELQLASVLVEIDQHEPIQTERGSLNGRLVQQRLLCMMKAFASVNGPHQLFKHKILLSIFLSFVGSQDSQLSQVALSCVLRFKLPYLTPYADILKKFYEKGKSRDAMMELSTHGDAGKIDPDHRNGLIPVVSRLLFGRLSARQGSSKSAKDSPAARRIATISFLSSFCVSDDELYPFLYLMTRVYIPTSFQVLPLEMQDITTRRMAFESICTSDSMDCYFKLPGQVHQGFLNVLGVTISQLGQKLVPFVPSFMSIVISLYKVFEVKVGISHDRSSSLPEEEDACTQTSSDRGGMIRSLCYNRLADIFELFSDAVDLHALSGSLWDSMDVSLRLLPVMVLNSEKVPSLLRFLLTISAKKSLFGILRENQEIIPSVLQCLSDSSTNAVIEATLSFIENLLDDDEGRHLLQRHIELLLDQFHSRLRFAEPMQARGSNFTAKGASTGSNCWRRELSILCRVSELVDESYQSFDDSGKYKTMESLCILLIPYLDMSKGIADSEKQRVLDILELMVLKVPSTCAASLYVSLGSCLGLLKSKVGMPSLVLRKCAATVLNKIADTSYLIAGRAAKTLLELCAVNAKRVNEMEFDAVIPAISSLGVEKGDSSWSALCFQGEEHEPAVLLPLVNTCFCFLLNDDGVVSRSSFKALTSLITLASENRDQANSKWKKLLESSIVPSIKSGLNSHSEFVRRLFILLLKEVAQANKGHSSPSLFTDLNCLIHNDEPDLDFFLNITHVQLHRRSRALQRLRKLLVIQDEDSSPTPLSLQALSSVLLPLATHPIYECKTKLEESFALEGIATVGAISRHLSWSKYNALLWNHLNQFDRHPELEKYLVGLVCSIIDGFHFKIESQKITDDSTDSSCDNVNSIWKALENRIIPKVESMVVKEKDEKKGRTLRPSILLALHKLIHKLPASIFQAKLPRLLTVVCDALRNRESDARDVARVTLAKMVTEMDMSYLADVLRELATSLTEGFKLHVRSATVHTILLEIAKGYEPDNCNENVYPTFDKMVPAFMDLIQQDIFGEAQERKDAQGSQVRFVKEAGGSKSAHSLELIATMILFRPCPVDETKPFLSSIHALVTPFLERLRSPGVSTVIARRIKECLTRIVSGLLRNPSVSCLPVAQFVHATLDPFVSKREMESVMELMDDDASSDEDNTMNPIHVSGKKNTAEITDAVGYGQVVEWRPSTLKTASSAKSARLTKEKEEKEKFKVRDGVSAPKLTGSSRMTIVHGSLSSNLNDVATIHAVVFGLQLLNPMLKNNTDGSISDSMLDQFVPLLTTCVCRCRTTEVVLLSLRCLGCLLRTKLPSLTRCSKSLATKTLELLTTAGSNQEQLQATFKMLTLLMAVDQKHSQRGVGDTETNANNVFASETLPLNDEQLRVLLSYLRESIVSSDQHNSAIALTKAIMAHEYISVEMYDLMETMLEQSVRSSKSTVRDQCGVLFLNYLINYPLSAEKIEQHLKQVALNITYEYSEGRLSAIGLLSMIVDKLPEPILEQHCQLFFLPLTLQLVNDDSKECRELVAKCIGKMLRKVSVEVAQSLYGYVERWSKGDVALQRMSLRLFAILVDVRPDLVKRNDIVKGLLTMSQACLEDHADDWEMMYFTLLLIETVTKNFNHHVVCSVLWDGIIQAMVHEHAWVKMVAVRLITNHIQSLDLSCDISPSKSFLASTDKPGLCFSMARNLCLQFNIDEEQQNDEMTAMGVKGLTWTLQAISKYPSLCSTSSEDDPSIPIEEEDDQDRPRRRDPVQWIMARLSQLARSKGSRRRQAIFKCFAAFATYVPSDVWSPHLEKLIEPLYRTEIEARNDAGGNSAFQLLKSSANPTDDSEEAQLARDVLQLLETHCASHDIFLQAYQQVQQKARERKEARKAQQQTQVITDPAAAAQKRIQKQTYEKKRRQRRVQEQREQRGGIKKRRHGY